MRTSVILFILGLLVWAMLVWPVNYQNLTLGIVASLIVVLLTRDIFAAKPHVLRNPSKYLWFVVYVFVFIWECFKANVDVAFRVSHPAILINPGIVKVKTGLKSKVGLTFLANTITLTPGTLSVDIRPEEGYLYVHCIAVKAQDIEGATRAIVDKFERILKRIFE